MATTIRATKLWDKTILPVNRKVQLQDVGGGNFQVLKAETDTGELKPTVPFVMFLQTRDFRLT